MKFPGLFDLKWLSKVFGIPCLNMVMIRYVSIHKRLETSNGNKVKLNNLIYLLLNNIIKIPRIALLPDLSDVELKVYVAPTRFINRWSCTVVTSVCQRCSDFGIIHSSQCVGVTNFVPSRKY